MIFTDEQGRKWECLGMDRQRAGRQYLLASGPWVASSDGDCFLLEIRPVPVEHKFGNGKDGYVVFEETGETRNAKDEWVLAHCEREPYAVWQSGPSHGVYSILRPVRVEGRP